jgi:transcriptional regulator with XRE-family HTH domain
MVDTSKRELKRRDRAYYRRRQQNRVFAALAELFAEEARKGNISKKELAEILGRNPSQITRWLSAPSNLELDTISDLLLAMGAEMDHRIVRFSDRAKPNYAHPLIVPYLGAEDGPNFYLSGPPPAAIKLRRISPTANSDLSVVEIGINGEAS